MEEIKFSNYYFKFPERIQWDPKAKLIQALKIHYNDLSKNMIEYDTVYSKNGEVFFYNLPRTDLILLIFAQPTKIFTTIRRYTPNKWEYYKKNVGQMFKIVIQEK